MQSAPRILIIQTAFVGDVILATGLPCKLKKKFPKSTICFLVRKGNEELIEYHPDIDEVWVWDKKGAKNRELWNLVRRTRKARFDLVVNVQRHFSTGFITAFSGAEKRIGFSSNPLSVFFSKSIPHEFPSVNGLHEVERNTELISDLTDQNPAKPFLKFSDETIKRSRSIAQSKYIIMAPASVWNTKALPVAKWIELMDCIRPDVQILLAGAPDDRQLCEQLHAASEHTNVSVIAGEASLATTAQLMKNAEAAFVNDSAPLHMASAFNTPTVAFFCSTLPGFGFFPLSEIRYSFEKTEPLECRPCGLHGKSFCPQVHFKCGNDIRIDQVVESARKRIPVFI